jgi:arsenate reductase (thioredoxin)
VATILFVCLQNAGRSQMSQALFTRGAGGAHDALSAGATPAAHVHPEVIEVMRELDIDLSDRAPQLLTRELVEQADLIVTMGCGDQCPSIPSKRYIDWELSDPAGQPVATVRAIRDLIVTEVNRLLTQLDSPRLTAQTDDRVSLSVPMRSCPRSVSDADLDALKCPEVDSR